MKSHLLPCLVILTISLYNINGSYAAVNDTVSNSFDAKSEEVQAALRTIKENMVVYTLTEIIIDFLEELYILTHHKSVQYKSTAIFEIIHIIENADLKMPDLKIMRNQILLLLSKHPDIRTMEHLKNHIIVDFDKIKQFLNQQFAAFVEELERIKTIERLHQKINYWRGKDAESTMGLISIFYYWFDGIMYPKGTTLWVKKLREILLKRLKLERILWRINEK